MQDYNAWTERYNAFMLATEGGTFWAMSGLLSGFIILFLNKYFKPTS